MRLIVALLILGCVVSLSPGQWVETIIQLPDSLSGLDGIGAIQFHAPNNTIYVAGSSAIVAVDAASHRKLTKIKLGGSPSIMCSSPASNKLYCAIGRTVSVVDCASNWVGADIALDAGARDLCHAATENKLYIACPDTDLVYAIDCVTDSVVARIDLPFAPSALCYVPRLNRVYSAQSRSDEVAVIDCASDTVIKTIWVRGVEPIDVCYDSVTNCVYTANGSSGTVSVIDCAGDTLVRVVAVGDDPWNLQTGPQGKIFCGGDDTILAVVDGSETRTIPLGGEVWRSSYDPTNRKVYYATEYSDVVTVVDAAGDSILAEVVGGGQENSLCYDPIGNCTWAGGADGADVGIIDGMSDRVTETLRFGVFYPGALRYNPLNNHLYCLELGWGNPVNHLVIIDGDSGYVQKILPAGSPTDSLTWNPVNNKVYFGSSRDNTVSILDCVNDSIVATVQLGESPGAMCCSDGGKVYVTTPVGGIAVIDGSGDSVRKVIPVTDHPWSFCYDRTDNKVYVGKWYGDPVSVIDVATDSVTATVPVLPSYYDMTCWDQRHNKVYVYGREDDSVSVIDCTSDTIIRNIRVTTGLSGAYIDTTRDKIYFADTDRDSLRVVNTGSDTFYKSVGVGAVSALLGNGRPGPNGRLYCTDFFGNAVHVVDGSTDAVLRRIPVGREPSALAWDPVHSRMYVANYNSSSITVLSDTALAGIAASQPQAPTDKPQATVVNGVLFLPSASGVKREASSVLLDVSGRKVLELHSGANDVRALAPGVYFVREKPQASSRKPQAVRKVVLTD